MSTEDPNAGPSAEEEVAATEQVTEEQRPESQKEAQEDGNPVEKLASEMGWKPGGRRTAEDYIKYGRQQYRTELERTKRDAEERFQRLEATTEQALKLQREQLEAHYRNSMRHAAAAGDVETFDKLENARKEDLKAFDERSTPKKTEQNGNGAAPDPEIQRLSSEFALHNSDWFGKDQTLTNFAIVTEQGYVRQYPGMAYEAILDKVQADIDRFRGAKVSKDEKKAAPATEGGLRPIKTAPKRGFEQLPPEAKAAFRKFSNDPQLGKIYTNDDKGKAHYVEQYWAGKGETNG